MTEISETDYKKIKLFFKKFNCKNVVQYLIYYCTIDVYMMCEAFEFIRRFFMSWCKLDPARYFTKDFNQFAQ